VDDVQTGGPPVVDRQWLSCVVQGDMTEQGELLRLDVFTVVAHLDIIRLILPCGLDVEQWLSCVVQGDMTEQGELLRLDVFTVWKNKKDERSLRSLKSQTRHVLLYERHVLFCKKKEDSASNSNKSVVYVLKNSLPVS